MHHPVRRPALRSLRKKGFLFIATVLAVAAPAVAETVRSAGDGPWSATVTWEGGRVPGAGDVVLVRPGHRVVYDVQSEAALRAVHVGGALSFSREADTLLCAGLVRIAAGEDCKEEGFDCHVLPTDAATGERPALEVGTAEAPLPPERKAVIRLTYIDGMDKRSCPALVCCGGRMDLHGAPLERTWQKLGYQTPILERRVLPVPRVPGGWRAGDRVLFTGTGPVMPGNEGFLGADREKDDNAPMRDITRSEV